MSSWPLIALRCTCKKQQQLRHCSVCLLSSQLYSCWVFACKGSLFCGSTNQGPLPGFTWLVFPGKHHTVACSVLRASNEGEGYALYAFCCVRLCSSVCLAAEILDLLHVVVPSILLDRCLHPMLGQ